MEMIATIKKNWQRKYPIILRKRLFQQHVAPSSRHNKGKLHPQSGQFLQLGVIRSRDKSLRYHQDLHNEPSLPTHDTGATCLAGNSRSDWTRKKINRKRTFSPETAISKYETIPFIINIAKQTKIPHLKIVASIALTANLSNFDAILLENELK